MGMGNWWNTMRAAWQTKTLLADATGEVKAMDGEVKPGWKTSEFRSKCVVQIASVLAIVLGYKYNLPPDFQDKIASIGMGIIGAVEASYSISRGIAKKQ